ncbi:MAG TPA: hypothetical protein VG965_04025 [Patescibacteria group bacterium]|nr:hypothetical protein [Patescibacteria group bacterium]
MAGERYQGGYESRGFKLTKTEVDLFRTLTTMDSQSKLHEAHGITYDSAEHHIKRAAGRNRLNPNVKNSTTQGAEVRIVVNLIRDEQIVLKNLPEQLDFTDDETTVVASLLEGFDRNETAELTGFSLRKVRHILESIYVKTGSTGRGKRGNVHAAAVITACDVRDMQRRRRPYQSDTPKARRMPFVSSSVRTVNQVLTEKAIAEVPDMDYQKVEEAWWIYAAKHKEQFMEAMREYPTELAANVDKLVDSLDSE